MTSRWMRLLLGSAGLAIGGLIVVAAGILTFDAPVPPKPMGSIENTFNGLSFSNLPRKTSFIARDGTHLAYRAYPGNPAKVVVLIHGSSGTAASMHFVAEALQRQGATVYSLCMRGHCGTGRSGDIDHIGQLDNDLVDFMKTLPHRQPGDQRVLLGFSTGGGFALRFAGGRDGKLFSRFVLVSPQLPPGTPTWRTGNNHSGQWVSVAIGRIVALSILSKMGVSWFNGLPVLAFAVPPSMRHIQTAFYSYRMIKNFGPSVHYLTDLQRTPGPIDLLIGSQDQLFLPHAFAPLLKPVRPDLKITIVLGVDHMGMITKPAGLSAIAATISAH